MSNALLLYRLQQIDSRLKQVTSRLNFIHTTMESNVELRAAVKRLDDSKTAFSLAEKMLKNSEYESNNLRVKLELAESSLYSGRIQSPKELQDLQKEIIALKRHLGSSEDKQLEEMMALEKCAAEMETAQKKYTETQGKVISENASLTSELTVLQKEVESLTAQRQAVIPAIDSSTIVLYDSLRQKRSGLAVSQVIENACDACGSSLTPSLAQSVRTSGQLVLCPMCGRILYSN